jgi:hypothetical protein
MTKPWLLPVLKVELQNFKVKIDPKLHTIAIPHGVRMSMMTRYLQRLWRTGTSAIERA